MSYKQGNFEFDFIGSFYKVTSPSISLSSALLLRRPYLQIAVAV